MFLGNALITLLEVFIWLLPIISLPSRSLSFHVDSPFQLIGYNDAGWVGCLDTQCSDTGWCMFLGNALVTWKINKQAWVSKFSIESEYRTMFIASCEVIWLQGLLADPGFPQPDSTNAIQITANLVFRERPNHIEVDCHSIHEAFDNRVILLPKITSDLQLANVFTKAIPRPSASSSIFDWLIHAS